jgi:CHAD domain-containing protein
VLRDDLAWLRRCAGKMRDIDVMSERIANAAQSEISDRDAANGTSSCIESNARAARVEVLHIERSSGAPARIELATAAHTNGAAPRVSDWRMRLCAEREIAHRSVVETLASSRFRALLAALTCMPDLGERVARATLPRFRARVERAGFRLERSPNNLQSLHRLRRAVRRMRYALDWLGEDARKLKSLQDELGELNNCVVLLQHLERECAEHGALGHELVLPLPTTDPSSNGRASVAETIELEIARRRERFLEDWSRARPAIGRR